MLTLDKQRVRMFICFGAHSNLDVLLLGYNDRNCTPVCYQTCNHTSIGSRLWIDIDFGGIRHIVMLTLDEQRVRTFICFGEHSTLDVLVTWLQLLQSHIRAIEIYTYI